ncbi:hypothetical protein [Arthrobacter glacialis]|uniref:Uncharacterized protein n=1 Tax=Arthrobacter glacialis TaxID=1664 RepID=A0A2S3ZR57_ARTGL|nr:hypothetical protein [Arthrobacter glacialis]POH71589.1 hypothetical protein CVS27_20215 [Arthrobacter glacialis]
MRSNSFTVRLAAHAVLLAFAGMLLVAFGCSGAQASAGMQVATASVSAAQFSPATETSVEARIAPVSTACIPGRDKVRLERDTLPPSPAQLQPKQNDADAGLSGRAWENSGAVALLGRMPASLTHLDLGIVRT